METGFAVNLTTNPFIGSSRKVSVKLPKGFEVRILHMNGWRTKGAGARDIERSIKNPIGSPRIKDISKGKKSAAILFDDVSRGTRVYEVIPIILDELAAAGIKDVRFIAALGAHAPHTLKHHEAKLGKDVLERFPVFNHNPFGCCTHVGNSRSGVPIKINSEFMACDVKIGIGSIVPHSFMGFGGGGKIVLPGVSHIETIVENHRKLESSPDVKPGATDGNPFLEDVFDALKLSGLHFKVDFIVGYGGKTLKVLAGDPFQVFTEGVKLAKRIYSTPVGEKVDVVIANSAFKVNEAGVSLDVSEEVVSQDGDIVIISDTEEGQVVHFAMGNFGPHCQERKFMAGKPSKRSGRIILQSPLRDIVGESYLGPLGSVIWTRNWDETLEILKERWKGKAKVGILPDATIQFIKTN